MQRYTLFYRSQKGAEVGDLFMSLIHTAELAGASSFEYLTALQKHREEAQAQPAEWMPWNYQATLRSIA